MFWLAACGLGAATELLWFGDGNRPERAIHNLNAIRPLSGAKRPKANIGQSQSDDRRRGLLDVCLSYSDNAAMPPVGHVSDCIETHGCTVDGMGEER